MADTNISFAIPLDNTPPVYSFQLVDGEDNTAIVYLISDAPFNNLAWGPTALEDVATALATALGDIDGIVSVTQGTLNLATS